MAVFFGLMHGALTRQWGYVEVDAEPTEGDAKMGKVE